jgi:hypothetical protein
VIDSFAEWKSMLFKPFESMHPLYLWGGRWAGKLLGSFAKVGQLR